MAEDPNPANIAARSQQVPDDVVLLSSSSYLSRRECLRRRHGNLKQISRCYKQHYWALIEELRIKYREYYWKYGIAPFKEEESVEKTEDANAIEGSGESNNFTGNVNCGRVQAEGNINCQFMGCKMKAMALTFFCHLHILSDPNQKLYKACSYVIKSSAAGPVACGKPVMRSVVPCLCCIHFQKAQNHVVRALKKAGLNNISSPPKVAPKLHVLVAEFVRQIQHKRRSVRKALNSGFSIKDENGC